MAVTDDQQFLQQLRAAFKIEAEEHAQAISSGLIELEKNPAAQAQIVEKIFREAHSLKGASRAVNRGDIESVCQAIESVFAVWKHGVANVPAESFDLLNRATDFVGRLIELADV